MSKNNLLLEKRNRYARLSKVIIVATSLASISTLAATITNPADLFGGLADWKLDLPIGPSTDATDIKQPQLATFSLSPYFELNPSKTGVNFRALAGGARTSANTAFSRSELRQMSGTSLAAWSCTSGTDEMTVDQTLRATTTHMAEASLGQIHDDVNDIVMIKYKGPAYPNANGTTDTGVVNANFNNDSQEVTLDTNYTLGDEMTVDVQHSGNVNTVTYRNVTKGTSKVASAVATGTSGPCYFKAGLYIAACSIVDINGNTNSVCAAKPWKQTQWETDPKAFSELEIRSIVLK